MAGALTVLPDGHQYTGARLRLLHFGDDWPEFFATTVEGIWQGLKRLDGECQIEAMRKPARKRRGRPDGHNYGDYRLLAYGQAKALIYIPAYLAQLRIHLELIQELHRRAAQNTVTIVDVTYQPDVFGPRPISHASLLVDYLENKLGPYEQAHQRLTELAASINAAYFSTRSQLGSMISAIPRGLSHSLGIMKAAPAFSSGRT